STHRPIHSVSVNIERSPAVLLLSQVFPPAIGGSGELLGNVYSRLEGLSVTVWTDRETCAGDEVARGSMARRLTALISERWGLLDARSLGQHLSLVRDIVRIARARHTVVHCGRAQPEAIPAFVASKLPPHPKYLFWVHGEEVTTALTSRDFAWTMR